MSIAAAKLLRSPNCSGVKIRLLIKLIIKEITINRGSCPCQALKKTKPKVTAIIKYSTDHTGPNSQDGGAQAGFLSLAYQL